MDDERGRAFVLHRDARADGVPAASFDRSRHNFAEEQPMVTVIVDVVGASVQGDELLAGLLASIQQLKGELDGDGAAALVQLTLLAPCAVVLTGAVDDRAGGHVQSDEGAHAFRADLMDEDLLGEGGGAIPDGHRQPIGRGGLRCAVNFLDMPASSQRECGTGGDELAVWGGCLATEPSSPKEIRPWFVYGAVYAVRMFFVPPRLMPGPPCCGEQLKVTPRYMDRPPLPPDLVASRLKVTR